ncbi:MAG TPA: FAD-dependent monooxygenase [Burkholderiales bacterium]|nr:FAD-dependent monooxygenase [Burkholderiales bacterium]
MDTDVLIVGAGPTGLMLANQLARHGVRAMIIDRHSGPAQQSRAMAVQARTLEIYSKMGIVDKALELGARGAAANMWANGRLTARIPIGDIGRSLSPYPFVLMLGQDDNERIMGASLRESGVDVQWNTELAALRQHPGHVDVALTQPDGAPRSIRAAWVAGCDGSRSAVREMIGITFPGAPYEHVFFVADTEATGAMKQGELNVYLWQDGFHLFFPMRGKDRWRVIGILPGNLRHRDDLAFEEVVPAIRREAGAGLSFRACSWMSTYRIHHRAAERFRDRRCFLLGDAAHVHSPMGAQGMNTGLQDAYNLAWKLALVVKGRAGAALLDTYEQERIPVAQRLLRTTDRAFQLVVSDNWLASLFRTKIIARIAARAMTFQRVRTAAFRTISQIGIRYRHSPLSKTLPGLPGGAPAAGDRFPWMQVTLRAGGPVEDLYRNLDDTRFNLLVFGQPAPAGAERGQEDLLRTHVIPVDPANDRELARAGISGPACFLLRPDGHIGLAGGRLDADVVNRYFAECHMHRESQDPGAAANRLPVS